jgi:hypothetical protein
MNDVTRILRAMEQGDARAADQLMGLIYDELRRLAASKMAVLSRTFPNLNSLLASVPRLCHPC